MYKQQSKTRQGFTIIEVVLVLAIAGLIFLMVFIAWPALQRGQRDTQRRDDYAALSTSVTNYMTNNNGKLPLGAGGPNGCAKNFDAKQLNNNGTDPNGEEYDLYCTTTVPTLSPMENGSRPKVYVIKNATCGGDNGSTPTTPGSGNRSFVIYAQLESGTYCNASS